MNGVIIINKEKDYTSFDVIAVVRKLLKQRKCGHTGTLDPNARGVLPVLLGSATKAQDILVDHDKEYLAHFRFGLETDTLDIWGKVLKEEKSDISEDDIRKILPQFTGKIKQIPPMFSSVMINGRRLYDLAREGKTVERQQREIEIYDLSLKSFDRKSQSGSIFVRCSKGTYIRTLIDDIAKRLGTVGVMTDLLRTAACSYTIDEAVTLDELKEAVENGNEGRYIRSVESLFLSYDEIKVTGKQSIRFQNGNPLDLDRTGIKNREDGKIYRVKNKDGAFLSLGVVDNQSNSLKLYKHF